MTGRTGGFAQVPSPTVAEEARQQNRRRRNQESLALAREWRGLGRIATGVAVLASPIFYLLLSDAAGIPVVPSVALTIVAIGAFRGLIDVIAHWFIPAPSIYGAEAELQADVEWGQDLRDHHVSIPALGLHEVRDRLFPMDPIHDLPSQMLMREAERMTGLVPDDPVEL
jgi:hypothetical protein